jgi:cobalt/nickel transport system ATP-binding protein
MWNGQSRNHDKITSEHQSLDGNVSNIVLCITHLTHRYANSQTALNGVTFTIKAGECVALVGPNGAGKTTLFLRLCGVLTGQPGQATICGLDPALPSHRSKLPQSVGIVFQNPDDQLFSPTVLEDVAFGPLNLGASPDEARSRAMAAISAVGLPELSERSPTQLSGGDKRRVALAGVLAMNPSVLLLDEPTAYLDPRGRRDFIQLIDKLPGTKLIATHDLEMVLDLCSRVIILDSGRVVADGPANELLANQFVMEKHGLEVPYRLRSVATRSLT